MNKPVAWLFVLDGCRCVTLDEDASYETQHNGTPLYTHPVKELTDEEILDISDNFCLDDGVSTLYEFTASGLIDFARAILRKASEK